MSKINFNRMGQGREGRPRHRVRILRSWRGYPVGTIIEPPAGMRQILLQAKDAMGAQVAELVDAPPVGEKIAPKPVKKTPAAATKMKKKAKK